VAFERLARFGVAALRRPVFTALLRAFEGRFMASPLAKEAPS
jgi:hypothetical protein